jgi:hypothetical protein
MDRYYADTHPKMEALQFKLLRQTPPWRKMELMTSMINSSRSLAWAGLKQRHSLASEAELRRKFASLLLGADLLKRICEEERADVT